MHNSRGRARALPIYCFWAFCEFGPASAPTWESTGALQERKLIIPMLRAAEGADARSVDLGGKSKQSDADGTAQRLTQ